MTLDGALDTDACLVYVEQVLCPTLRPGQIVLMDNLSPHKADEVQRLIEKASCQLRFFPSYSPDFSPIEHAFSKIKALLRKAGARTKEALEAAIATAIDAITQADALGYFRHCGFRSLAH
jgi:transposase